MLPRYQLKSSTNILGAFHTPQGACSHEFMILYLGSARGRHAQRSVLTPILNSSSRRATPAPVSASQLLLAISIRSLI